MLCFSRACSNFRNQQIDTKRRLFVDKIRLQLFDRFPQNLRRILSASNNAQSACVCDRGGKLGRCSFVHARKVVGMVDP
jgi:hypothetical protein